MTEPCTACQGTGTIKHEEGLLPCPYCHPDEAKCAAFYPPIATVRVYPGEVPS